MESIDESVAAFFGNHNFNVFGRIGFGIHGQVFSVTEGGDFLVTVVKFFEDAAPFYRELCVYRRLGEEGVSELAGCKVPRLIEYDDELLTIQMSLVTRPFCLDFAAAYLDGLPDYFPPLDAEWHESKREQFGDEYLGVEKWHGHLAHESKTRSEAHMGRMPMPHYCFFFVAFSLSAAPGT